jgi:hypothetical protein
LVSDIQVQGISTLDDAVTTVRTDRSRDLILPPSHSKSY